MCLQDMPSLVMITCPGREARTYCLNWFPISKNCPVVINTLKLFIATRLWLINSNFNFKKSSEKNESKRECVTGNYKMSLPINQNMLAISRITVKLSIHVGWHFKTLFIFFLFTVLSSFLLHISKIDICNLRSGFSCMASDGKKNNCMMLKLY